MYFFFILNLERGDLIIKILNFKYHKLIKYSIIIITLLFIIFLIDTIFDKPYKKSILLTTLENDWTQVIKCRSLFWQNDAVRVTLSPKETNYKNNLVKIKIVEKTLTGEIKEFINEIGYGETIREEINGLSQISIYIMTSYSENLEVDLSISTY